MYFTQYCYSDDKKGDVDETCNTHEGTCKYTQEFG